MAVLDVARYLLSGVSDNVSSLVKRLYIRYGAAFIRGIVAQYNINLCTRKRTLNEEPRPSCSNPHACRD